VQPRDPAALATGIRAALPLVGMFHADPHSWSYTAKRYATLLSRIGETTTSPGNPGGGMGTSLAEEAT
jgi:hypothetical protein